MQATFSIGYVDPVLGTAGAATASRYPAVGALTIHCRAGAGVVITQSVADRHHAAQALPLLAANEDPATVLRHLLEQDSQPWIRQIALVRHDGQVACHSGERCLPVVASVTAPGRVALGNMLVSDQVPREMVASLDRFLRETPHEQDAGLHPGEELTPSERVRRETNRVAAALIEALRAGESAGGDKRGKQAAAVLVVAPGAGYGGIDDRAVDLRVDDHPDPVGELQRLFGVFLENQTQELLFNWDSIPVSP